MCLAQGHNAVKPVRLEPAAPLSQVKHSTTEPLRSLWVCLSFCLGGKPYIQYRFSATIVLFLVHTDVCLFPGSTVFQSCWDASSWVEPVLSSG